MVKVGDVVFFKRARTKPTEKTPEFQGEGHMFGLYLGVCPPNTLPPPSQLLMAILGSTGLLTFDDVGEFLGAEAGKECVRKFEIKYLGKKSEESIPPAILENGRIPKEIPFYKPKEPE